MFVIFLVSAIVTTVTSSAEVSIVVPEYISQELNKAVCLVNCSSLEMYNCSCGSDFQQKVWNVNPENNLGFPALHCREDTLLAIRMQNDTFVYVIEYKTKFENAWNFSQTTKNNLFTLTDLEPHTAYKIRIWAIAPTKDMHGPVETGWIKTLQQERTPRPVPKLELTKLSMIDDNYVAAISWNPSKDLSCYYEFVWFGGDEMSDYTQKEIRNPASLYHLTIDDLQFDSNYSVAVMTKSSDWMRESEKTWLHFSTRPCLEVRTNLDFCSPPMPTGLEIRSLETSRVVEGNHRMHNILLTWDAPELQPSSYTAKFLSIFSKTNNSVSDRNVSGEATRMVFENVDIGLHFQISLVAWSPAGGSPPAVVFQESTLEMSDGKYHLLLAVVVIGIVLLGLLLMALLYYKVHKNAKKAQEQKYFEEMELKAMYGNSQYLDSTPAESYKDEWEVNYCDLRLMSKLGEGAFGVVRKAILLKGGLSEEVAVKMLREETRFEEVRQFRQEIEILKSVGRHPHIVSMIGCCTKGDESPKLIVEYCAKGDLLSYLRNIRENIIFKLEDDGSEPEGEYESAGVQFFNKSYHITQTNQDIDVLEVKDLLSIGRQVATGMEYLSNLRVVHRDLAARNVLVCGDRTVKVSDFGLSRDVYKDNVYCKLGSGKLPLRWMAVESLTHQLYTTKSDVWSFGILMWEIFTLGGKPYPNIADMHKLLESLKAGERMTCPDNCGKETYSLMLSCWKENPKDRPTFAEICSYLETLLENTSDYLNLNTAVTPQLNLKGSSECDLPSERYVH